MATEQAARPDEPTQAEASRPAREPAPQPAARSGLWRSGWVLLLVALALLTYHLLVLRETLTATRADLDKLQAGQTYTSAGLQATRSATDATREAQGAVDGRIRALESRLEELTTRLEAVNSRLTELAQLDTRPFERLAQEEVAVFVALAEQRLLLARDVPGALAALNLAQARADTLPQPLREALRTDTVTLAAFHDADLPALAAAIGQLGRASLEWPLRAVKTPVPVADDTPISATNWRALPRALWHELRQLIDIHPADGREDPLLDPEGVDRAHRLLQLELETARLAVLARDPGGRDQALQAAAARVRETFDDTRPEVRAALASLETWSHTELSPSLPVLTSTTVLGAVRAESAH